jgi:gamma-butyrobetaine dioxygenase
MTSLPASVSPAGPGPAAEAGLPDGAVPPEPPGDPAGLPAVTAGPPGLPAELPAVTAEPPGIPAGLPAVWLRFNCPCALCHDPVSGQRPLDITAIPADISVAAVSASPGPGPSGPGPSSPGPSSTVEVRFHPDGHRAVFDRNWLARYGEPARSWPPDPRTEDAKRLWSAADLGGQPARGSWPRYLADAGYRRECQSAVLRDGLLLLSEVPPDPGAVLGVAASLGYVRETSYGRLFDVRAETSPSNLAFTSLPIPPHTDNPYRDPVPTLQLLHCLRGAADGGDSGFVDGFRAAAALRAQDPAAFATLAVTPVTFAYRDAATELSATRPLISLDPHGRIREIRVNSRSLQPVRLPGPRAAAFYAAYRTFAGLLSGPAAMLTVRLGPGDCAVFDNTRVLHARTGFARAGRRHLQGCYADLDGLESAVAVGGRATTDDPRRKDPT